MEIPLYLALTTEEFLLCEQIPSHCAWICRETDKTVPKFLPQQCVLVQTADAITFADRSWECIIFDINEKEEFERTNANCAWIPPGLAGKNHRRIFMPPVPMLQTPEEYLSSYKEKEIILECALDAMQVQITDKGIEKSYLSHGTSLFCPHYDPFLCCHYRIEVGDNSACITLKRTMDDIRKILSAGAQFGVIAGIGLWQELHKYT